MTKTGPKPTCACGDLTGCRLCRKREQQRRYSHGLPYLPILPRRRIRESRLHLPTDPVALAYIAGLFDGEGCITKYASNQNWVVQIGMTDRDVIEYLAGLGGTMRTESARGKGTKILYRWRIMAQAETQEFLAAVVPYLRVKRALAEKALDELLALERQA